jgi:hypothetical protein
MFKSMLAVGSHFLYYKMLVLKLVWDNRTCRKKGGKGKKKNKKTRLKICDTKLVREYLLINVLLNQESSHEKHAYRSPSFKGAFRLGVRDTSVELPKTMLVI